jgi:hypothetical protein
MLTSKSALSRSSDRYRILPNKIIVKRLPEGRKAA